MGIDAKQRQVPPKLGVGEARALARAGILGCQGLLDWLRRAAPETLAGSLPFLHGYARYLASAGLNEDKTMSAAMNGAIATLDACLPRWRLAAGLTHLQRARRKAGGAKAIFTALSVIHWAVHRFDYPFDTEQAEREVECTWLVSDRAREQLVGLLGKRSQREEWVGYIVADDYEAVEDSWYDGSERFEASYPQFREATLDRLEHDPSLAVCIRNATANAGIVPELTTDEPGVLPLLPYQVRRDRELFRQLKEFWCTEVGEGEQEE